MINCRLLRPLGARNDISQSGVLIFRIIFSKLAKKIELMFVFTLDANYKCHYLDAFALHNLTQCAVIRKKLKYNNLLENLTDTRDRV